MTWIRGHRGYAKMLLELGNGPQTVGQLAKELRVTEASARACLLEFEARGLAQRAGTLDQPGLHGTKPGLWALGGTATGGRVRAEMLAFVNALRAIQQDGPATARDIMRVSGMHHASVRKLVGQMLRDGQVHIREWAWHAHIRVPAYVWGPGKNAAKPKPMPRRQIDAKYEAARRQRDRQTMILRALAANSSIFNLAKSA